MFTLKHVRNLPYLGSGCDAYVYRYKRQAIKVGGLADNWLVWANLVASLPALPFLPRIYSITRNRTTYIARMELLNEANITCSDWCPVRDWFSDYNNGASEPTLSEVQPLLPLLRALKDFAVANDIRRDLHSGNIMRRQDGQLVITDPFSGRGVDEIRSPLQLAA